MTARTGVLRQPALVPGVGERGARTRRLSYAPTRSLGGGGVEERASEPPWRAAHRPRPAAVVWSLTCLAVSSVVRGCLVRGSSSQAAAHTTSEGEPRSEVA